MADTGSLRGTDIWKFFRGEKFANFTVMTGHLKISGLIILTWEGIMVSVSIKSIREIPILQMPQSSVQASGYFIRICGR